MKNFLYKNWKTTSAGFAVLILTALYIFKIIDTEQFLTIFGVLTTIGLFASKDGDKTGINSFAKEIGLPKPKDPKP